MSPFYHLPLLRWEHFSAFVSAFAQPSFGVQQEPDLSDPAARTGKRFIASVRTQKQRRIEADRLRRDYPDVAAAVTVEVSVKQVVLSGVTEDGQIIPLRRARDGKAPRS
jgi:hypothetical protein